MFNRGNPGPEPTQAPPTAQFPDMRDYFVVTKAGEVDKIAGHHSSVENGVLQIHRGLFINEECTQVGAEPAMMYPEGEWTRCYTLYRGYEPQSSLAL